MVSQSTEEEPRDYMSCGTHSSRERRFDLLSSKAWASKATQDCIVWVQTKAASYLLSLKTPSSQ